MSLQVPQVDYSKNDVDMLPKYKMSQIYQQTGGTTATIGAAQSESIFELPNKVCNLSRDVLAFTATPTGGTAYNYLFADVIAPIQQVQLYTRGGTMIADLNYQPNYSKIVLKAEQQLDDIEYNSVITNYDVKCNILAAANQNYNGTTATTGSTVSYDEQLYLRIGTSTGANPILTVQLPLNKFKNTLLALDKDVYFNEVVLLKIVWGINAQCGVNATNATEAHSGAEDLGNIAITNLYLYHAIEKNDYLVKNIMEKVMTSAFTMYIPYVHTVKSSVGTGVNRTISLKINRSHGIKCKRIYHTLFASESLDNRYNNNNTANTNIVNYYTNLDNERIQEFNIVTASNHDYMLLKPKLKGTSLETLGVYKYNWFHVDCFDCGFDNLGANPDNINAGLDLSTEHSWDFVATTADAINFAHYSFIITSKMLTVSRDGVFVQ